MNKFTIPFGMRILLFFCVLCLALFLGGALSLIVMKLVDNATASMRIMTIIQDILIFTLPAIVTALIITRLPASFLCVNKQVSFKSILLVIAIMIISMPAMNYIIEWNESLSLPEGMANVEDWMRTSEQNAKNSITILMGGVSIIDLIMSILIIGIMTGFAEEILFRGTIQRLLQTSPLRNAHIAIWITAFIFSAIHLQFLGFFPRLLLGAFFGYLLWWSRSLWLPVIAHAFNNSMVVIFDWLERKEITNTDINKIGIENSDTNYLIMGLSLCLTILLLIVLKRNLLRN